MSGRIPRQFIDDLLVRVDIVDLIDSHVPLKKSGSNFVARCPFHVEKTPSFSVNRNRQIYHCFGCGVSGNAISFLMAYSHLDFVEAVEDLAAFVGVEAPREAPDKAEYQLKADTARICATLEAAAGFYAEQLAGADGAAARKYLAGRGVSQEVVKRYALGYAPNSWDALTGRFDAKLLAAGGMLVEKPGGKGYDRFRGRLMFPIRDKRGRVVGFGGRVLDDSLPKYLNSPETAVFSKGRELYGLYELLDKTAKPAEILVAEGYMDVISLAQFGVLNAVAALGTATSRAHIDLLFRFAANLVFCFDGDNAGRQAAWRAVEAALPCLRDGRQIRIMLLPQGHDPDSLIRGEGVAAFQQRVSQAVLLSEYFFQQLGDQLNLQTMEGRSQLLAKARPYLDKVPGGFFREMMFERLRQKSGFAGSPLEAQPAPRGATGPEKTKSTGKSSGSNLMRTVLSMLLQNPVLARQPELHDGRFDGMDFAGKDVLENVLQAIDAVKPENCAVLLESFRDSPQQKTVNALANRVLNIPEGSEEQVFQDALTQLWKQLKEARMSALIDKLNRGEALNEDEIREFKTGGKL